MSSIPPKLFTTQMIPLACLLFDSLHIQRLEKRLRIGMDPIIFTRTRPAVKALRVVRIRIVPIQQDSTLGLLKSSRQEILGPKDLIVSRPRF